MRKSSLIGVGYALAAVIVGAFSRGFDSWMLVAVTMGILTVAGFMIQATETVNPFVVYLNLLVALVIIVLFVMVMSVFNPWLVLFGSIGMLVGAMLLNHHRGEGLRKRRESAGLCLHCGYDLRASELRCPECGNEINEELKRRRRIAAKLAARRKAESDDQPAAGIAEDNGPTTAAAEPKPGPDPR